MVSGSLWIGMQCAYKRYMGYLIRLSLSHALYSVDDQDNVQKVWVKCQKYIGSHVGVSAKIGIMYATLCL